MQLPTVDKGMKKLTHLTEDVPTSKVHARMMQPTFMFAKTACEEEKEERVRLSGQIHLSNSRSAVSSSSPVLSKRPSLLVWRKSAAEPEMLRSVRRKPVPIG